MASSAMASGELYFAGERDPRSQDYTSYIKVGIVRSAENRSSADRMKEHQTGNPRELVLIKAFETPVVEQIETLMHGAFAPLRLSGEWFFLSDQQREEMMLRASQYVLEAQQSITDMERAEELKKVVTNGLTVSATDDVRDLHRQLVVLRRERKALEKSVGDIDDALRELDSRSISLGRYVTLAPGATSEKFDSTKFKKEHPDLWAQFTESAPKWSQRFNVTEGKELKATLGEVRPEILEITDRVALQISQTLESADIAVIHEEFLKVLTVLSPLEWEEKRLESRLKSELGENKAIEEVCTWTREYKDQDTLDKDALQETHPEIYGQYVSVSTAKPKLTIMRDRRFIHS